MDSWVSCNRFDVVQSSLTSPRSETPDTQSLLRYLYTHFDTLLFSPVRSSFLVGPVSTPPFSYLVSKLLGRLVGLPVPGDVYTDGP